MQVRLWNVVRSQQEILGSMRDPSGVEAQPGLVAYWKFDDSDRYLPKVAISCEPTRIVHVLVIWEV